MQAELKAILDALRVGGSPITNALMHFDGESDAFLVYSPSSESVALAGDDLPVGSVVRFDLDVYSKENYLAISEAVVSAFVLAGWTWFGNSNDTYDHETKMYHRLIEVGKERGLSYE